MSEDFDSVSLQKIIDDGHAVTKNGVIYNIADVEHKAEEYEACMMALDDLGAPRSDKHDAIFSLFGRVKNYIAKEVE